MLDEIHLHNRSIVTAAPDPAREPGKRRPGLPYCRPGSTAAPGAFMGHRVAIEQDLKKSSGPAAGATCLISFALVLHGGVA
jgi:hypothetical protein